MADHAIESITKSIDSLQKEDTSLAEFELMKKKENRFNQKA